MAVCPLAHRAFLTHIWKCLKMSTLALPCLCCSSKISSHSPPPITPKYTSLIPTTWSLTRSALKKETQTHMVFSNSHSILLLPTGSYKEHAGGSGTTGIWVGTPWFSIAMIQKNEVQLPLMHWKLEQQRGTHPPSWSLEVPFPTPVGHVSGQAVKSGCEYLHARDLQWNVVCQFSIVNFSQLTLSYK